MFRLVGAVDLDTDVVGLILHQGGQTNAQMVEMQARHPLVEQLRQHVDLFLVLAGVVVQGDLGEHLVGERRGHHEAGVPGRTPEIQEPTIGEHHDAVPIRELPLVVLRLDVDMVHARYLLEPSHVDLVVEVPDVAHDRLVLHAGHLLGRDDVPVAGRRDEDVGAVEHRLERVDLVALHRRLQRADRVDLGDHDPAALSA